MTDALSDFTREPFTADGKTKDIYRKGDGPAVIVISEIPGITPKVADFARMVVDRGCTAVMPHLFGEPGKDISMGYTLNTLAKLCISSEFTKMATKQSGKVTTWLRALARSEHERCGGPGVGVVGMCFTGGFALGMMVDAPVVAPVLSQPSVPFPFGSRRKADLGISDAELAVVKQKVAQGGCVMGLRFTGDPMAPADRFATLRRELGDGFIGVELDSSESNPHGHPKGAHSVLTEHLVDQPGTPTREALDQVLDFFTDRLGVTAVR
ncbi:MAG TPA: dienelactone hydrolase family protein [Mycobacteriales bacterium]|nr:dienelactone hydrolase family protein [Mycobacteriales bacterium]